MREANSRSGKPDQLYLRREHVMGFSVGDKVIKNPAHWEPNDFDGWGRGEGTGEVVEPPFELPVDEVDVRWPAGRCFEAVAGLLLAPPDTNSEK
jgi:hypothetical protein